MVCRDANIRVPAVAIESVIDEAMPSIGIPASRNPDVARLRTSSGEGSPLSRVQAPCPVYVRSPDQLNASAEFSASYATHKCT